MRVVAVFVLVLFSVLVSGAAAAAAANPICVDVGADGYGVTVCTP